MPYNYFGWKLVLGGFRWFWFVGLLWVVWDGFWMVCGVFRKFWVVFRFLGFWFEEFLDWFW